VAHDGFDELMTDFPAKANLKSKSKEQAWPHLLHLARALGAPDRRSRVSNAIGIDIL
jgi:hypothetical protein